jgi:dienelactone hydrolase
MRMTLWGSRSAFLSCVALAACAAGSDNTAGDGTGISSSGGAKTNSTSSSGSSGTGTTSGSQDTSSGSGTGTSSGQGTSSGSSGVGDDSGSDDGGSTTDDGGSGSTSGGSTSDSGASNGCDGFAGYIRGAAPTSTSASVAGPYQTMSYAANASVRSTMAYDVTSAHIYYPVGATAPFTAIAVVPGFTAAESSIADWGPFLASWGIVVMTFGTSNPSTGASDTSVLPPVRSAALLDALTTIKGENTRSGSPLKGELDVNRLGTAGWSMGGGGTLIAANSTPSLKATFAMEPWNTSPTYPMDTVPTLIFAGTADGLAGPPMPQNQYMSIPATTPKILYEVQGGSHYVSTSPTNSGTDMAPDTTSTPTIARFGLSWLKVYLECDTRFRQFLLVKPADAAEFDSTVM